MPTLPATLTLREARRTLETLAADLLREGGDAAPVIDATALQTCDTSALAVLLECRRLCQAAGKRLVLQGAPSKLLELARLYGVEDLLELAPPAAA